MPKAFVSHSTLDQERFVHGLAERLQSNGVETWFAGWALLDGDSLTERIFEQGIGEADIFIVVLSKHSIDSNWVKAELAVGLVRQIEKKCRLIPIVLDGVAVPVSLESTLQRRIEDVDNYDADFDGLLRSIFRESGQPPLGPPPSYASAPRVRGLTASDAAVYVQLAELVLDEGWYLLHGVAVMNRCAQVGLSSQAVIEGIHALDAKGFVTKTLVRGDMVLKVQVRPRMLARVPRWAT